MEYVSPDHPRYEELKDTPVAKQTRAVYQQLDEGLAKLLERTTENDLVMFMSDHGHQPCTRACTMDRVLAHLGWAQFSKGSFATNLIRWGPGRRIARRIYDLFKLHGKIALPASPIDWANSRAYTSVTSTGEGVSLNLKGREPRGHRRPQGLRQAARRARRAARGVPRPRHGRGPDREDLPEGRGAVRASSSTRLPICCSCPHLSIR